MIVIINWLTKIIYYEVVKIIINVFKFAKVIIDKKVQYYNLFNLIMNYKNYFFTLEFWFLLCYFLGIKKKLFFAFYL